jgi:hypothetical protein
MRALLVFFLFYAYRPHISRPSPLLLIEEDEGTASSLLTLPFPYAHRHT